MSGSKAPSTALKRRTFVIRMINITLVLAKLLGTVVGRTIISNVLVEDIFPS